MANPTYAQSVWAEIAAAGPPNTVYNGSNQFPAPNTPGNLLVCWVRGTGATTSVTGSVNGAYSVAIPSGTGGSGEYEGLYYFPNCGAGQETVQVINTGGGVAEIVLAEYSDVALTSPLDGTPVIVRTSAALSVAMITLTANDLLLGLSTFSNGTVPGAGTGFTLRQSAINAGFANLFDNAGPPFTANSAGSNTFTQTGATPTAIAIAAFKQGTPAPPSGGPGTGAPPFGWVNTQGDHYNKRGLR